MLVVISEARQVSELELKRSWQHSGGGIRKESQIQATVPYPFQVSHAEA